MLELPKVETNSMFDQAFSSKGMMQSTDRQSKVKELMRMSTLKAVQRGTVKSVKCDYDYLVLRKPDSRHFKTVEAVLRQYSDQDG